MAMQKYFSGIQTSGDFDGRLIWITADLLQHSRADEDCWARDALLVMGNDLVAYLIGANPEVRQRIKSAELHGKEVTVSGTYEERWNLIFVDDVREYDDAILR